LGNLTTPKRVQKLQMALHAKAKAEAGYRFLCPVRQNQPWGYSGTCLCPVPLQQGVHRELTVRTLRTSKRMGSSGGWPNWRLRSGRRHTDRSRSDGVFIPKANGKLRPLGISTVRGSGLHDSSDAGAGSRSSKPTFRRKIYAYRAGRNAQQAAVEVEELLFSWPSGSRGRRTSRTTSGAFRIPTF